MPQDRSDLSRALCAVVVDRGHPVREVDALRGRGYIVDGGVVFEEPDVNLLQALQASRRQMRRGLGKKVLGCFGGGCSRPAGSPSASSKGGSHGSSSKTASFASSTPVHSPGDRPIRTASSPGSSGYHPALHAFHGTSVTPTSSSSSGRYTPQHTPYRGSPSHHHESSSDTNSYHGSPSHVSVSHGSSAASPSPSHSSHTSSTLSRSHSVRRDANGDAKRDGALIP